MTTVIEDILIIRKSHIVGIRKDTGNVYRGDILETVFQDSLYFISRLVIKEKVKTFVNKLLHQTGALY